jgi:hypothetical protein
MEDKTCKHIMAFLVRIFTLLTLSNIELSEEIESKDSVDVAHNREKTHSKHKLFAIVGDGLQDDP